MGFPNFVVGLEEEMSRIRDRPLNLVEMSQFIGAADSTCRPGGEQAVTNLGYEMNSC
jgi:hypothetical protein